MIFDPAGFRSIFSWKRGSVIAMGAIAAIAAALAIPAVSSYGQQFPLPKPPHYAWSDTSLSPDQRADLVIQQMTLDEKIQLVHGAGLDLNFSGLPKPDPRIVRSNGGGGFVPGIKRLGIPDLNMDDSAVGAGGGARKGRYSTALPSTLALASSWSVKLAREDGALIGRELADEGFNVSLGGGVDITREPRNGRNFEYEGEDPILAGNMVAGYIEGIQSQDVIGDVKHYALNDEETGRYFENSILDRRAMRETDLLAFEIAVKKARPGMVMCSYNLINGVYACQNNYTLNEVLKKGWGFKGWVVSDWFATHSTVKAALAGLDQEEPGSLFFGEPLKEAVENGKVPMSRLNDMVHRILRTEFAKGIIDHPQPTAVPNIFEGFRVAQQVEEQGAVLLRNEKLLLPLDAGRLTTIAVIGSHADVGVLSGGGSAQVDAAGGSAVPAKVPPGDLAAMLSTAVWDRSSPLEAIRKMAPAAHVTWDAGTDAESATSAARAAEVAIVFVNQPTHEGNDVQTLGLPGNQDEVVEKVAAANPRTVVVLETGGPVSMPWAERVGAILEAWYPGIRGGQAIADLLFGKANPSGKLAVTFPVDDSQLPRPQLPMPPGGVPSPLDGLVRPRAPYDIHYTEGLDVGYKWYDARHMVPLFPFGFGLSYTTFAYSGLRARGGKGLTVRFNVRNTGRRAGEEVAEVYLSFPKSAGEPPKRLIAWKKIALAAGESQTVSLDVDPLYLSVWDVSANHWKIVPGEYEVLAGSSSRNLPLHARAALGGS